MTKMAKILSSYKGKGVTKAHLQHQIDKAKEKLEGRTILNNYTGLKAIKHTGAGNSVSVENILKQRETTHGAFPPKATTIQVLKNIMRGTERWRDLSFAQQESLDMVMTKVGRILHGNPNELDHWLDIIGYTKLISDELENSNKK